MAVKSFTKSLVFPGNYEHSFLEKNDLKCSAMQWTMPRLSCPGAEQSPSAEGNSQTL